MNAIETALKIVAESQAILSDYEILQFSPVLDYVDIFPQNEEEHFALAAEIETLGKPVFKTSTGTTYKLFKPVDTVQGPLELIRVRIYDETRTAFLGHPDYAIAEYEKAKEFLLQKENVGMLTRPDYDLIEVWDPKYKVLLYIPSVPLTKDI